jgi:hypothetical protein
MQNKFILELEGRKEGGKGNGGQDGKESVSEYIV